MGEAVAQRGDDAAWFRKAAKAGGMRAGLPGRTSRGRPVRHHKRRDRIKIVFDRLKYWRRGATRHERCPKVLLSAVALAATVIPWP